MYFRQSVHKLPHISGWEAFKDLKTAQGLFEQIRVDSGGYGISWNDRIDIACDELWYNGAAWSSDGNRSISF